MFKIRLARPMEYTCAPGTGKGYRQQKQHVQRELPGLGIRFFAKLRTGEPGSFQLIIASVGGLLVGRAIAHYRNRRHRQKTVFK